MQHFVHTQNGGRRTRFEVSFLFFSLVSSIIQPSFILHHTSLVSVIYKCYCHYKQSRSFLKHFNNIRIQTTFLPHILSSETVIGSSVHFNECKQALILINGRYFPKTPPFISIASVIVNTLFFSSPDPKDQVSYCHLCASVICPLTFHILINSSETTGQI